MSIGSLRVKDRFAPVVCRGPSRPLVEGKGWAIKAILPDGAEEHITVVSGLVPRLFAGTDEQYRAWSSMRLAARPVYLLPPSED